MKWMDRLKNALQGAPVVLASQGGERMKTVVFRTRGGHGRVAIQIDATPEGVLHDRYEQSMEVLMERARNSTPPKKP